MHIASLRAVAFRRFADLTLTIPGRPRLVVVCGPNGVGKSALFDAMRVWLGMHDGRGFANDGTYLLRPGRTGNLSFDQVAVEFHEGPLATHGDDRSRKSFYFRTAYRNDPEFQSNQINRAGSVLDAPVTRRMIDNDVRVSENYTRLVARSLEDLFSGEHADVTAGDLSERYVGQVREAMLRIFPDLHLVGPGDPLGGGTFMFRKGVADGFQYKNLSGGEKAAFDLLLDLAVKTAVYDDTVVVIDEPEAHLNTRVQGAVLSELLGLVNDRSQLWVATHSIGMMRFAQELSSAMPDEVAFLDLGNLDFDQPVSVVPTKLDRVFWARTLDVALGDLASLVAPSRVVLCEGQPATGDSMRGEFDARCFERIFGDQMPETAFMSVGNSREVAGDVLGVGAAITTLVAGTQAIRVVDRDLRSSQEIDELRTRGVRVLSRRHLEAFLVDDEVLVSLCEAQGSPEKAEAVLSIKRTAMQNSLSRGNDADDFKSAAGEIYTQVRRELQLVQPGNSTEAFLRDTLAPLLRPGMAPYESLRTDIFG